MDAGERMWQIEQIKQLKARYLRLLDTKQWGEYRSLFTDNCKFWLGENVNDPEPTYDNMDELMKYVLPRLDDYRVISIHHGHTPEIELTSDRTAKGIWAMYDWVDRFGERAFEGFGYYYEEYEKGHDDKWRISSFKLIRLRVDERPPSTETLTASPKLSR